MSVNPDAINKILYEMDQQLQKTQADLQMTNIQLQRKQTSSKIAELTLKEINSDPAANLWEGVGKAFFYTDHSDFVGRLEDDQKTLDDQMKSLATKKTYLETTMKNTIQHMQQMMGQDDK
ncbi:hypothetical protein BABINDRAFT_164334 [Babjeviella inositovora NRRL Y-12698]|uniref:Prefoldin subunit 1 n=1 Tax=Babjeviella inositovora NRRL Y-12698 TaxID=984486 RepID=A0A1E3QY27_9ASCO|nr:uncharacterized protein BABINDRAFT_164334 [Babjeviella inositovora NRRL Y-12698]ODQ82560.1 hypothetical protein BABINDRAFT_164334 [Babjeviella inositovora NRRL Y-12698]